MPHAAGAMTGKVALVTGAAKRLGRAMALALADAGAHVFVHFGRSADAAALVAEQVRERGVQAWTGQADLADPEAAKRLIADAIKQAGAVDILINNASIFPAGRVLDVAPEHIHGNVNVHAVAPLMMMQAMALQGIEGRIVNLLDSRMNDYDRQHAAYQLSKRMLFTLTRMMALELAPRIAVNAVAPGLILPPPGEDDDYLQKLAHTNPLQRHGNAQDIADAVLFLLQSRFITGQVIYVDGGRHIKGNVYGS
jgi:pteridine reductase